MTDHPAPGSDGVSDDRIRDSLKRYWHQNILVMAVLLVIWATISFGCGILWVEQLNEFRLFGTGFKLGFWFAQQGSIIGFILIVLVYAIWMNRADRRHHEERLEILADAEQASNREGGE